MSTDDQPGIRVEIEIMPGYRPPARVAAALAELSDALEEASDLDVEGYDTYTKVSCVRDASPVGGFAPLADLSKRLVNNEVIEGIFKLS